MSEQFKACPFCKGKFIEDEVGELFYAHEQNCFLVQNEMFKDHANKRLMYFGYIQNLPDLWNSAVALLSIPLQLLHALAQLALVHLNFNRLSRSHDVRSFATRISNTLLR